MSEKKRRRAKCLYCGNFYSTEEEAKECRDRHDIIFVQLSREDVNRLLHFMYSKDERDIGPTLMNNLLKYQRRVALGKEERH